MKPTDEVGNTADDGGDAPDDGRAAPDEREVAPVEADSSPARRSDGGRIDADSPFRIPETEGRSRQQRLVQVYDLYVRSPVRVVWSDWRTRIGVLILLGYLLMGTVGVVVVEAPSTNQGPLHMGPFESAAHPLGTDGLGQDMVSLLVHATPPMLEMMISGGLFATGVATVLGTVSGYRAGIVDSVLSTVMDIATAIPGLPLAIVVASILQPEDPWVVGIVLTINVWAGLGRSIRSQVLTLREADYVEASRAMNLRTHTVIARDIVPNIMPYVTINFVNAGRIVVFSSVALYFLGVLPFTNTHWGVTMNRAYRNSGALYSWDLAYTLIEPMVAIVLLSLGLVLLSQGADRIFNPRVRARRSETIEGDGTAVEGGRP